MDDIQDIVVLQMATLGLCLCLSALAKVKSSRRARRFKVRPINRTRRIGGNFQYYKKIKSLDAEQFFKITRMTLPVFEKLLGKIKDKIRKQPRSNGISAEQRLIVTLQFLSQDASMQQSAWTYHMGLTTVQNIIHATCKVLWEVLTPEYLKSPSSKEEWVRISSEFQEKWNFPHCIGALDGKHINMLCPAKSGSIFYNYKKTFSIVLLAACDANYLFTLVVIENTFGILVSRWRILKTTINCKVENVDNVVKAVVVLHNYCKTEMATQDDNMYCPQGYVDTGDEDNGAWRHDNILNNIQRLGSNIARRAVYCIREALSNYFVSEAGKVPCQDKVVNRGKQMP